MWSARLLLHVQIIFALCFLWHLFSTYPRIKNAVNRNASNPSPLAKMAFLKFMQNVCHLVGFFIRFALPSKLHCKAKVDKSTIKSILDAIPMPWAFLKATIHGEINGNEGSSLDGGSSNHNPTAIKAAILRSNPKYRCSRYPFSSDESDFCTNEKTYLRGIFTTTYNRGIIIPIKQNSQTLFQSVGN